MKVSEEETQEESPLSVCPNNRVSTKTRAPSPPGLKKRDSTGLSQWFPGNPPLTMEQKENLVDKELSLVVVLPGGEERTTSVHGR